MWFFAIVSFLRSHSRTLFCFLDDLIRTTVICTIRNQSGSWILATPIIQIARYDRTVTLQRYLRTNKTIILGISLHFRFVLCFPMVLVSKGYRTISGRVKFNLSYRKPQTAALHLDYSRVKIDTVVDLL